MNTAFLSWRARNKACCRIIKHLTLCLLKEWLLSPDTPDLTSRSEMLEPRHGSCLMPDVDGNYVDKLPDPQQPKQEEQLFEILGASLGSRVSSCEPLGAWSVPLGGVSCGSAEEFVENDAGSFGSSMLTPRGRIRSSKASW